MRRQLRDALRVFALAWIVACGGEPGGSAEARRVVLVTIDTLRADHVGCYGHRTSHTPTLDSLAAGGVRFARAFSPVPITLPAHVSLMTGLDPPRHGVRHNSTFQLGDAVPTLAERLRGEGFATAAFVGAVVLDRQYGLSRGFDVYDDEMAPRRASGEHGFAERTADSVVDAVLAWLEQAPDSFFLWVHVYDPHANYDPPAGFRAAFPTHPYLAEIAFVDAQLGRLFAEVGARFDPGETLLAVTSDHGEALGQHGEVTHSMGVYDATQRVPLLLAGAGLPAGRVVEPAVSLVDLAPTILSIAGASALAETDGNDLLPRIAGDAASAPAYLETLAPQLDFGWSPLLGLVDGRHKYIRAPRPELYDLVEDPGELRDLAAERPELVAELDRALETRLARGAVAAERLEPGASDRARLEALGYVVAGSGIEAGQLGRIGGLDPKDGRADLGLLMQAMLRLGAEQPEQALALLEGIEGGGSAVLGLRAEAALSAGDFSAAERYARQAIETHPGALAHRTRLAKALEGQGDGPGARQVYEDVARRDPAAADPVVALGRLAEAGGDTTEAATYYEQAAGRRGRSAEALWRLAALRLEQGGEAEELLADLPESVLSAEAAALRLAQAERAAGQSERARARLQRALKRSPESTALAAALAEPDTSPSLPRGAFGQKSR